MPYSTSTQPVLTLKESLGLKGAAPGGCILHVSSLPLIPPLPAALLFQVASLLQELLFFLHTNHTTE